MQHVLDILRRENTDNDGLPDDFDLKGFPELEDLFENLRQMSKARAELNAYPVNLKTNAAC
jgi:hypothetical protein